MVFFCHRLWEGPFPWPFPAPRCPMRRPIACMASRIYWSSSSMSTFHRRPRRTVVHADMSGRIPFRLAGINVMITRCSSETAAPTAFLGEDNRVDPSANDCRATSLTGCVTSTAKRGRPPSNHPARRRGDSELSWLCPCFHGFSVALGELFLEIQIFLRQNRHLSPQGQTGA